MVSRRVASRRLTEAFSAESTGPLPRKSPSQREPTSATPAGRTHRVPPPTQMEERQGTEAPLQPRRVEHVSSHGKGAKPSEDPKPGADESPAPLRRPRLTEAGCVGAEETELSGGDVEPTAESPGSEEDSAVTGVGDLVEADSAPARGALGGVGKVEAWPPGWPELGGELGPAVSAADGTDGGAIVRETAGHCQPGASRSSRQPMKRNAKVSDQQEQPRKATGNSAYHRRASSVRCGTKLLDVEVSEKGSGDLTGSDHAPPSEAATLAISVRITARAVVV
ncbi:unnamed protein product [Phytophthora fragariaefolia]|uniref:Unnamed protein product n=1 Tax=Phytophthora fragariaefolia TaxID=1490495 RepID=A0A9W7D2K7_9STRA|nr:unnamed protein product [Phytophthora fragariaefolia]